tara:strand:- start:215 stop:412 length:198 start_codon:yes stop_codon:yes gene_type:complete
MSATQMEQTLVVQHFLDDLSGPIPSIRNQLLHMLTITGWITGSIDRWRQMPKDPFQRHMGIKTHQ